MATLYFQSRLATTTGRGGTVPPPDRAAQLARHAVKTLTSAVIYRARPGTHRQAGGGSMPRGAPAKTPWVL